MDVSITIAFRGRFFSIVPSIKSYPGALWGLSCFMVWYTCVGGGEFNMDKEVTCKEILICSNKCMVVDLDRYLDTLKCGCLNKTIF